MDRYLDLKLRPDPEFPATLLMNALLAKLHRALHDLRRDDIGISFPAIAHTPRNLGVHLRVHGSEQALSSLLALNWLTGMRDHVHLSETQAVPDTARHRTVSRVQVDSNPERARRRLIKRHGISAEEARQRIPDSAGKRTNLPFAQLRSNGGGQAFLLFIQHGPLLDVPQRGTFSGYGLSSTSTVPWF
ncbi:MULTISPECIES: type I-F CRISPR-associated endoribonuclease Cas6/Csy4 [unclassified Pseudomonas]|uniref:type I-F CRISPR-associated endoribonuclease Cas6/Csy4 n=1 Tax=unclassified Pseudomonas TaxID=196821 RepID=UPI0021C9BFEE|nr:MULTISPECIES: type I-F CRISPR-associated endoribonuclease Cas6/Csy4 [unclassified Pseudomonas]MCU1730785.1 type I-F CRISPR-associated endoribonuclease Cas6/Csy4 [Pseudomonas sp. 20P_3.2_Bac4]MCU1743356.1 type I-F CRISPR-associated endoribonuclease Cas6/Csy4 [Pseudomonas sp. 20P_3.2_Bac5]